MRRESLVKCNFQFQLRKSIIICELSLFKLRGEERVLNVNDNTILRDYF